MWHCFCLLTLICSSSTSALTVAGCLLPRRLQNNIVCRNSDGVYEGVAIGGDRYPGSRFIDHMLRYQDRVKADEL